jgi:hypothetical protein
MHHEHPYTLPKIDCLVIDENNVKHHGNCPYHSHHKKENKTK